MDNNTTDQVLDLVRNRYFGKYRGIVSNNEDATNRGRVKVTVPSVLNDLVVWAMPCVLYTGPDMGTYMMPDVGAGVWVEFEGGDANYPIWTGGYWVNDELPHNEEDTLVTPPIKIIKTSSGLMISFDDASEKLTLSDTDGSNMMTMEVQSGKIKIQANLKVVVEAPLIELVEGAAQHLVFGDNLLQYLNQLVLTFNSHMHPGELAAGVLPVTPMTPVPPMSLATPILLSTKVTTG